MKYSKNIFLFSGILCLFFVTSVQAKSLAVPFISQAPDGIWVEPWKNACEETSTMLVETFYYGYSKKNVVPKFAKQKILEIVNLENKHFGFNQDTNATQIAEIINLYLPWEARVVNNPTLKQIKQEIDRGRPVIIPVYGKLLNNAYYRSEQVDYHVFVISGYDDSTQEFITQEPATRYGEDYRYAYNTVMTAMHDFLPGGKTNQGRKVAVFTQKQVEVFAGSDADKDGLTKAEELEYGTILWLSDSDGDSYTDGTEVENGYSPTVNEMKLSNGTLIKTGNSPKVYLLDNGQKRHITNEKTFLSHGWHWNDIRVVSDKFIDRLKNGSLISS